MARKLKNRIQTKQHATTRSSVARDRYGSASDSEGNSDATWHDSPSSRIDFFTRLPRGIIHLILAYFSPHQLCLLARVSKHWHRLVHVDLNYFWWRLCMDSFWEVHARPKRMSVEDRRRDWKVVWVDVVGRASIHTRFGDDPPRRDRFELAPLNTMQIEVAPAADPLTDRQLRQMERFKCADHALTKNEMREYYKSRRSKPKGKKPIHVSREWETYY